VSVRPHVTPPKLRTNSGGVCLGRGVGEFHFGALPLLRSQRILI
jgi:hypothetical protein